MQVCRRAALVPLWKCVALIVLGLLAQAALCENRQAASWKPVQIGVSWSNFQEERWKRDEAAIKHALAKVGVDYVGMDAQASNEKQMKDIDALVERGVKAIIVLAWDAEAILPAVRRAHEKGVPVIAYDRLIQDKDVFYITFDNVEVGRIQAREVLRKKPNGNYVFIKGAATDPNSDMLYAGQTEALAAALQLGRIRNIAAQYTDGWKQEAAHDNMRAILEKNGNRVDAVVASNDGTAGGAIAALAEAGLKAVPVSGQDCDVAALKRIAHGEQTVSVFKDPRKIGDAAGWVAVELAKGRKLDEIPGTVRWSGGSKKIPMTALLLSPVAITAQNLDYVLAARMIAKPQLCEGIAPGSLPPACR